MNNKITTLLYTPFTGLGAYQGWRGSRWLKNRIVIFKQFVIPSWLNQSNRNFIHWISWRREEKNNPFVKELEEWLKKIPNYPFIFTYSGLCFYDDKYEDNIARDRLLTSLHGTIGELVNIIGDCDYVSVILAPSDDLYHKNTVEGIQRILKEIPQIEGFGFKKGYIINYQTKEVKEYNPTTNPPFYTIKFPRDVFVNPLRHAEFTAIKEDVGKYKKGTPCPSHEYIGNAIKYAAVEQRGFMVGCHGENISTTFKHPFAGEIVDQKILKDFGIFGIPPLKIKYSFRRKIFHSLPFKVQRKLRYWAGEKQWLLRPLWNIVYNFLRA